MTTGADLDPMRPRPYRVVNLRQETHDTYDLELEPTGGLDGFRFAAGQFNMLYLFGVGEAPISISGDPARPTPVIHTIRAVGPVTQEMKKLERGQLIGLRGPFGNHWPVDDAVGNDVVIVAGGIGLAPLRAVIYQILANRGKYGRMVLLYGARTPKDLLYESELHRWRGLPGVEVEVTVDRALDAWQGNVGIVTGLLRKARFDPRSTIAMICGPEIMMRFTVLDLQEHGVAPERLFISMERNMKCAVGFCGHCQFGPAFICKDGPVFRFDRIKDFFEKREI